MSTFSLENSVKNFIADLAKTTFQGDVDANEAARLVHSVDNSIYEVKPAAVIYPKNSDDVAIVTQLLSQPEHHQVNITAKGGGTGTNGQSLNQGIIFDLSRHMNQILAFDSEKHQVIVQTGVVKDQLNAFLKPHGFFFAPELSTSNRATIGGMINTDASGQGSYTYGKTSHHVVSLKGYLPNGQFIDTNEIDPLQQQIAGVIAPEVDSMNAHFPELNRFVTGYDAKHFFDDENHNLKHLLCGAEGTLAVLTEATLNVLPIPKYSTLVLLSYDDFISALKHSTYLMDAPVTPTSIEIMDDRVVERARNDFIWEVNQQYFEGVDYDRLKAILLVEFNSDDETELQKSVESFADYMKASNYASLLSSNVLNGDAAIKNIYALRKRAVGLLGNIKGERRTMAFVEDCAVPPESLADFIVEFKAILDKEDLIYGMFGHVDAGVLHVRPALDLKTDADRERIRKVSDQVYDLCVKYKGALWGEHGKGVRSEYCEPYFGEFYPIIRAIKTAFDPHNQMNPGKIAAPLGSGSALYKVDSTPMRGQKDQLISEKMWNEYRRVNFCNGNGACFNYDLHSPMCPSYKATRDRVQSPKGRAVLLKEWERRRCTDQNTPEFEDEIFIALETCLSCGSCTSECPVMINIPNGRSQFVEEYYKTRRRPLVDRILAQAEENAPLMYKMRNITNPLFKLPMTQAIMRKIGLTDATMPQDNGVPALVKAGKLVEWNIADIERLTPESIKDAKNSVIIVPDALTEYFDGKVLKDCVELLYSLGLTVYLAPYQNSGKAYHVLGMRDQFTLSAEKQNKLLLKMAKLNVPMIGIEPPITVLYRKDYKQMFGEAVDVQLVQEFLVDYLSQKDQAVQKELKDKFYLLSHCMEKTAVPNAPSLWQQVFKYFGLGIEIVPTGCCGMSGTFGHLTKQVELSEKIYDQSWRVQIDGIAEKDHVMATGFSCRTQVDRFSKVSALHPISVLNQSLQ